MSKESKTTIFEAYSFDMRLKVIEMQPKCAICGIRFDADNPPKIHSLTTTHIDENGIITSTTKGHKIMKGRRVDPRFIPKGGDARGLCDKCHKELHKMVGKKATPEQTRKATEFMIKRGKW